MSIDFERGNYKLRRVIFGEDKILSCTSYDENDISLIGFTHVFIQTFLPFKKYWLTNFTRVYQDLNVEGEYYLVRVYIHHNGIIRHDGYGASRELGRASDYACHHLAENIFEDEPQFILPPFLIGFPNVRGHCYLISAVLPILYSYPILKGIFDGYQFYCKNSNLDVNCIRMPGKNAGRPVTETPYFWVKILYDLFKDFHKVASEGEMSLVNVPYLQKKLFPELRDDPEFPDRAQKPDRDLLLDSRLIKGLCSIMTAYCDKQFGRPGGDEGNAYRHIISKLVSQLPELCDDLMLSMEVKFLCSYCVGGPYESRFTSPVIMVPAGMDFQTVISQADICAISQGFYQPHVYNEIRCAGKVRMVESATFMNRPKVLCFSVSAEKSEDEIAIPSTVYLTFAKERHVYKLLSSSVCFCCYKSKDGVEYDDFYHEYEEGDQEDGWHTYTHMETKQGAFEVNNGMIYNVDTRVFKVVTPSSMHFYQLEEYSEYKPDLKLNCVRDKPHHVQFRVSPQSDFTQSEEYDSFSDFTLMPTVILIPQNVLKF
uniref:Uncharacterized protein n=1 Tax=Tetranychus urticae TaxID=32264 RepID=T1KZT3_TETUR